MGVMGSLTEAYDRRVGSDGGRGDRGRGGGRPDEGERNGAGTRERPYLGLGVLVVASSLLAGAVVLATSITVATAAGLSTVEANEIARLLGGLGLPLVFVGVLVVVPASRRSSVLAVIGLALAVVGVGAFGWAYPDRWLGDALDLTLPIVSLYGIGLLLALLALVTGVLASDGETENRDETATRSRERGGRTSL
jgi:drug/metabolite transporter (DMT)-like permease